MLQIQIEADSIFPAHFKAKLPDKVSLKNLKDRQKEASGYNEVFIDLKREGMAYDELRFVRGISHRLCGDVRPLSMAVEGSNGVLDNVTYELEEKVISQSKETLRLQAKHHKKGKDFIDWSAENISDLDDRGQLIYHSNIFALLTINDGDFLKIWNEFQLSVPVLANELNSDLVNSMRNLSIPTELSMDKKSNEIIGNSIFNEIKTDNFSLWFIKLKENLNRSKKVIDFYSILSADRAHSVKFNDTIEDCHFKMKRYLLLYLCTASMMINEQSWSKTQLNFNKGLATYFDFHIKVRKQSSSNAKTIKKEPVVVNREYALMLFGSNKFKKEQNTMLIGNEMANKKDVVASIMIYSTKENALERASHESQIKKAIELAGVSDFTYGKKGIARLISIRILPNKM